MAHKRIHIGCPQWCQLSNDCPNVKRQLPNPSAGTSSGRLVSAKTQREAMRAAVQTIFRVESFSLARKARPSMACHGRRCTYFLEDLHRTPCLFEQRRSLFYRGLPAHEAPSSSKHAYFTSCTYGACGAACPFRFLPYKYPGTAHYAKTLLNKSVICNAVCRAE